MSEHWKSTPRYWCKHCQCFVRDTKLERANHEATGKHQGALKRFLRDLHRGHEKEEKDKERARQEIARLNGVVGGTSSATTQGSVPKPQQPSQPAKPSESQLQKQREQLLALGLALPDATQPEVAAPGEWTVTQTRIIEPKDDEDEESKVERRATGVRKREVTEEEKEEENAVQSLFKKPRRWGRDSRAMPQEEDKELDALLNGSLITVKKAEDDDTVKKEEDGVAVKKEPEAEANEPDSDVKREEGKVKTEPEDAIQGITGVVGVVESTMEAAVKTEADDGQPAPVFFKKRKAKGIRQK